MRDMMHTRLTLSVLASSVAIALTGNAAAQFPAFDSGSDGSDGALDFTGTEPGTVIELNPFETDPPLDPDGDNVFHFTTITIPEGVTVKLRGRHFRMRPVYWLAQGDVVIDGTLDLSGEQGHPGTQGGAWVRHYSEPGPGGFPGGLGAVGSLPSTPGMGPGGGFSTTNGSYGASGSFATVGGFQNEVFSNVVIYGNSYLQPTIGGSGGQGRTGAGGGGAGGGAILLATSGSIALNGTIDADGGAGRFVSTASAGAGSGGAIRIVGPRVFGTGSIQVDGGSMGPFTSARGGKGRIRIESFGYDFTGTLTDTASIAFLSPNTRLLPADGGPKVDILRVGGVDVPPEAEGNVFMADLEIDESGPATVELQGTNIPLGAEVQVYLISTEGDGQQIVSTTAAEGTDQLWTATVDVEFNPNVTQIIARATWTP